MAKKIYDILPPQEAPLAKGAGPLLDATDENVPVRPAVKRQGNIRRNRTNKNKKKRFPLKELVIGGGVIVFLLCGFAYLKLPKAEIQISPNIETISLQEKVTADISARAVNTSLKVIPARYIEMQQDGQQEFPATGSASDDATATGTIKIYNKIDAPAPFTLIKGTHFLSDSGKYFVTLAKIVIPAAQRKNGKLVAGSINVSVQAKEPGVDYNIPPSKFSIPKLNGSAYYYSIYGESTGAMTGGHIGKVKKVTESDIESAQALLTKELLAKAKTALEEKIADDEILLPGATQSTIVSASADVKAGAINDAFTQSATVKMLALVFKKQDVEKLMKDKMAPLIPAESIMLENSLITTYSALLIDMKEGTMALSVQGSAKAYQDIDTNELIGQFRLKSDEQIKAVLDQMYPGKISELKINFWPFWVSQAPKDKSRITVELNLE